MCLYTLTLRKRKWLWVSIALRSCSWLPDWVTNPSYRFLWRVLRRFNFMLLWQHSRYIHCWNCGWCRCCRFPCSFLIFYHFILIIVAFSGVVSGLAIGAIMFFAGKKGYDYYMAQSDAMSGALNTNPTFQTNTVDGIMPDNWRRNNWKDHKFINISMRKK